MIRIFDEEKLATAGNACEGVVIDAEVGGGFE